MKEKSENKIIKKRGRGKKKEEKIFVPSKYQEAIFNFVSKENGNLFINACSGSGKTTTILKCIDLIPSDKTVAFCAFNKDIVNEIKKRVNKERKSSVKTIHSMGYSIICENLSVDRIFMNEFKYSTVMNGEEFKSKIYVQKKKNYKRFYKNIRLMFNLCRCNLCINAEDIEALFDKYGVDIVGNEVEMIRFLMDYGKSDLRCFDFTDMIWIPYMNNYQTEKLKSDYIIVDEVQDVNLAQLDVILKCFNKHTRGIFVGDENQLIYGFSGTDRDSIDMVRSIPNTIQLPLSISYRCPKKVVDFVHTYCSTIESKEDAIDGEVIDVDDLSTVEIGDSVICRNNAPLMKAYGELVKLGKTPRVLGSDVSKQMIDVITYTRQEELNVKLLQEGVFSVLYKDLIDIREEIKTKYNVSNFDAYNTHAFKERYDLVQALEILSEDVKTSSELIEKIKSVFSNKKGDDVVLSTAHRSKGLEYNNVYIICNSLFNKKCDLEWEKRQEQNLAYVAYTRTKNKLCFVSEEKYGQFLGGSTTISQQMEIVENMLKHIEINKKSYDINYVKQIKPTTNVVTAESSDSKENKSSMFSIDTIRKMKKNK